MLPAIPTVKGFMTTTLVVVPPEMEIQVAMSLLIDNRISGVPVVSHPEITPWRLVGLLTERDCLSIVTNGAFHGRMSGTVADHMARTVTTVSPDMDLFAVAEIFLRHPYRRLPVIDREGFLVGNVSRRDVLNAAQSFWGEQPAGPPDSGYVSDVLKARIATTSTY